MKIVTLELKNDTDLDLLAAFTRRIDGEILKVEQVNDTTGKGPIFWLDELSKRGGINGIKNPSEWQREQRLDKKLVNR